MEFKGSLPATSDSSGYRSVSTTMHRPDIKRDAPQKDDTGRDCSLVQRYVYGLMTEADRFASGYKSPADVNVSK